MGIDPEPGAIKDLQKIALGRNPNGVELIELP